MMICAERDGQATILPSFGYACTGRLPTHTLFQSLCCTIGATAGKVSIASLAMSATFSATWFLTHPDLSY
jgi:hypothetical protein